MPISRNNALYYTKEQLEKAIENSNALAYAINQGYNLIRHGQYYVMAEHDSMVFTPEGSWFWNSRHLNGRALEFMTNYEGMNIVEAVLTLAGEMPTRPGSRSPDTPVKATHPPGPPGEVGSPNKSPPAVESHSKPDFEPPPKANNYRQLYGYLCKTRNLSAGVVKEMITQGILYQSEYQSRSGKIANNACFLSYDENGTPCDAYCRGLTSYGKPFKRETPGGDKSSGWIFHGKDVTELYVFEAAIDAASYVDLALRDGHKPLQGADYMALMGLQFKPIEKYLGLHPNVKTVHLMLDNDLAGKTAARDFFERLQNTGYCVTNHLPPKGKDWNEYLMSLPERPQVRDPPKKRSIAEDLAAARAQAAAAKRTSCPRSKEIER